MACAELFRCWALILRVLHLWILLVCSQSVSVLVMIMFTATVWDDGNICRLHGEAG